MSSLRKLVPDLGDAARGDPGHESSNAAAPDPSPPSAAPAAGAPQPVPVASWYAQGMSDGLGDRLLMFDNTAAASLELLRFRSELSSAPGFERALRDSVERLAFFKHAAFGQARAVEYLDGDDALALVSTHTPGKRLSDMFQGRQPRGGMHPAFVAWLIRQLAPAVADFHAHGRGIAHGVLTPERIVLTPDGRVVIIEHVLGTALDQLCLSPTQLWRDLGVVAVPGFDGVPRLTGRADVVQLALVALSVLLGRRVTPEDYASRMGALLDEFADTAGKRSPSLVPPLREWLERALQLGDRGFASALDAAHDLQELPTAAAQQAFEHLQPRPRALSSSTEGSMKDSANGPVRIPVHTIEPARAASATAAATSADADRVPNREEPPDAPPIPHREESKASVDAPTARFDFGDLGTPVRGAADADTPPMLGAVWGSAAPPEEPQGGYVAAFRRFVTVRNIAVACGVLAFAEGAIIAGLLSRPAPAPAPAAAIPLTIDSPVAGDVVMVDGRQVGVTPFNLEVVGSMRSIRVHSIERLQAPPASATAPGSTPGAAEAVDARAANAIAAAAARQRRGGLRLSSPIELQVLEGERVLGSSADGPIVASAGIHQLDFINTALGYRQRQVVDVKAGEIVGLTIKPPDGRISINAQPWAQVWIDGRSVGETPLANLSIPLGEHEIIFRHPQLGEKREKTLVKSGATIRLSVTMGR